MSPCLEIRDLAIGYGEKRLFSGLSMDINRGSTLAVMGANGTGKSSFVKMVLGLLRPKQGSLTWCDGQPPEIGYLAQLNTFDRWFPIRVRDLVAMGAWNGLGFLGKIDKEKHKQINAAMDAVGISHIADQSLHTLSGGQLQRSLFARVMLQDAPLILLDEPFIGIDQSTEADLLNLIDQWRDEGRAVALVLHDLSSVLDHCDQVLLLGQGKATHGDVKSVVRRECLVDHGYMSSSQAKWMFQRA